MSVAKYCLILAGMIALAAVDRCATGDGPREGGQAKVPDTSQQVARERAKVAKDIADANAKIDAQVQEVLRRGALEDAALQAKIAKEEEETRAAIQAQRAKSEAVLGLAPGALEKIADMMDPEVTAAQYKALEAALTIHPDVAERVESVFADNVITLSELGFVELLKNRFEKPQVVQRTKAKILELKDRLNK